MKNLWDYRYSSININSSYYNEWNSENRWTFIDSQWSSLRHFYSNSIKYNLIVPDRGESRVVGYGTMMIQRMKPQLLLNETSSSWYWESVNELSTFSIRPYDFKTISCGDLDFHIFWRRINIVVLQMMLVFNHTTWLKIRKTGLLIQFPINSLSLLINFFNSKNLLKFYYYYFFFYIS